MMVLKNKQVEMMEMAESLFADYGYSQTGIRDIALKVGTNSSMVNYYFQTKENLLKAIILYRTTDLEKFVKRQENANETPLEQLYRITEGFLKKAFSRKSFYKLLIQIEASQATAHLLNDFNTLKAKNFKQIEKIIAAGQQSGIFKQQVDALLLSSVIAGSIKNVILDYNYLINNILDNGIPEDEAENTLINRTSAMLKEVIHTILQTLR